MTTQVTVTNNKDSNHLVTVKAGGLTNGSNYTLEPGENIALFIWDGSGLYVQEGQPLMRTITIPKTMTGPVYIEEDGTVRDFNPSTDL